eukprot:TRINITY_DN103744_c0_g1_i1.p1 TRINITY_DN103744_c0_g1~~TRINITY_DN103744_c0_g1_i1.p1  ORF type:complete len:347 (-),score=27.32 TRINITY_DN103744_c0_g1_i1:209-1249(-)
MVLRVGWFLLVATARAFPWPDFLFYPLDPSVGNIDEADDATLSKLLRGRSALVVGGTDGIGRGTALALAKLGADVAIVGHSPAKRDWTLGNLSAMARYPKEQHFRGFVADLLTIRGCLAFSAQLKASWKEGMFDYMVLTVGMWPDSKDPQTADGIDKVIALDVIARWTLTNELSGLLAPGARVMSVLGSTMKVPAAPPVESIEQIVVGRKRNYGLSEMLGSAGVAGDTWLYEAAKRHPGVHFIGTWPGVVASDIARTYFPPWLYPFVKAGEKAISMTAEASGKIHVQILLSSNAGLQPASYFNVKLQGRRTNPLAYNAEFARWLWDFLNKTVYGSNEMARAVELTV